MDKISVILTTYNGERFLRDSIESILNQDGTNQDFELELIVVDDCSTDQSVEIINSYNVILLSTEKNSGGPNKGRNLGLRKASGNYISIADQDDIWEKDRILNLLPYIRQYQIVSSGYTVIDKSTNKSMIRMKQSDTGIVYYPHNVSFINKLTKSLKGQNTYLGSLIYHASLKEIEFEEMFGMVDFDWVLRLFHQAESVEVCKSLLSRYVDGSNLSLNNSYRSKDFYYSLLFIEGYQNDYPEEVELANLKIHSSRARYYYLVGEMKKARFYFLRSNMNIKNILYYATTFAGNTWVKKHFNVFG